jgi:hypothetical protein
MKRAFQLITAVTLMCTAPCLHCQVGDPVVDIKQRLSSQFKLTKTTFDSLDIVTSGSILVLQKDRLLMCAVANGSGRPYLAAASTYKDGRISHGFENGSAPLFKGRKLVQPRADCGTAPQRTFVAGEKFWIRFIAVDSGDDGEASGMEFFLYSDPYNGVRYHAQLQIPFPKGSVLSADQFMKTVAEVLTVQPDDNAATPTSSQSAAQAARPEETMTPIPPPQPPSDTPPPPPKKITLGQTKDHVVATFGHPQKVVELGAKEIFIYSDMKVTFVNGKVTDVQ